MPEVNNAPASELPPVPPKDPAVDRLTAELAQTKGTVDRLVQAMSARPPATPPPDSKPPDKVEMQKEFFKNPLDHTAAIAQNMSEAVTRRALSEMGPAFETLKEVAKSQVRASNPEIFDKYEMEIMAKVASTPAQFHSNIGTWQIAFDAVKGVHLGDILKAERDKAPTNGAPAIHVSREGGPSAPSPRAPNESKQAALTDDEKMVARRLGLTEDQYRRGKEHYSNQSERGPSSWDKHITFDSRKKRQALKEERSKNNGNNRNAA